MSKEFETSTELNESPIIPECSDIPECVGEAIPAEENTVGESDSKAETAADPQPASIFYPKREFKGGESVFAWVCMLVGYLFFRMLPPFDEPLGMLIAVAIAIIGTTAILIKKGAKFGFFSIISAFISLGFATSLIFAEQEAISTLALLCSAAAYLYFVYSATGNRAEGGITNVIPLDVFRAAFVFPFINLGKLFSAMFAQKNKSMKSVFKVLLGLILAIIPTAIVVAFLSYDAEFSSLFSKILGFIDDFNLFSHLASALLGTFVAMYIFGLYVTSTDEEKPAAITSEMCEDVFKHARFVPILTVAAALAPLLSVYVIFFISQWKYYVSAFTGVLPEGVSSYAEYARDGFFELCAVSVINFIVIIVIAIFQRREKNGDRVFLRLANITVSVMTLVLIGTAMAKMWLYINEYGLTEKRVLSSWFMAVLALIYVAIILGQLIPKIKLVAASLFIVTVMTGVISFANHPAIIANYNVDLYISGKTELIDVETLYMLGDSAVPALTELVEFWNEGDLTEKQELQKQAHYNRLINALERSSNRLDRETKISSFSIPSYRAEKTLDEFFKG